MNRRTLALALCLAALAAVPVTVVAQEAPLLGFTPEGSRAQKALEARYDALLRADSLRDWMRELTDKPFYVDSEGAHENAEREGRAAR